LLLKMLAWRTSENLPSETVRKGVRATPRA
jgi:hypothetical protein